ncbi:uncharacterized protein LOC135255964 isoform X2 [Anguilla rostrata]|uniref:uncharacterized protein LOC135255964 isoform X2 n=1 Tax=Anguilla rostrata TaxID=7938 RepID=UPI0030CE94C7
MPKPPHPLTMTSPSLPTPGSADGQCQARSSTVPPESSDDYFALSSSAAPGQIGISPTKAGSAPVALSDDVTAAPLMGCASALAPDAGSVAPSPADLCGSAGVGAAREGSGFPPTPVFPAKSCSPTATESRGGAVLSSGGGAVLSSGGGAVLSSGGVAVLSSGGVAVLSSGGVAVLSSGGGAVLSSGGGAVLDSGGRAVLSSGGGARQGWGGDRAEQREQGGGARQGWGGDRAEQCDHGGSLSPGSSCFLIPSCTVRGKVGRMRSRGMKGRARQRDRRISIKIRLRRQSSGELWEIVSVREEGAVSTPRGGHSSSRGWGLRHRQNQPTLSRLARSKDGLPEVKRPSGLSVGSALPQRICRGLSLTPPSTMTSPPTHTHLPPPPPHRPVPLQHIHPAHNPVPLPPAPPIPEDSDEQIEKLLDDIMMGLNILPPIVVETDAGGHGDSRILEPSPGAFGTGASGPCPYQCPQITESPRPKNRLMCSRTQDGPFPTNRQSRYISSHETTYPRVPQQASDELHILDRFLFSRENHADGAWERSALGHSDGGVAVTSGDLGSLTQPGAGTGGHPATSITPATSAISKAPSVPAAQSTLGHSSSPWRELRIPEFLSPPPPIRFRMDELRLPDCLSPLGAEAGLPPSASPPSGPAPLPPQPLPPWLCPFPVPLHVLSTPLPDGLQVPSFLCPPKRRRGQHGSPRGVARGGRTGAVEEAGRRKIVTRGLPLDERRKRKGWKEEESEEQRSRKKMKQAVSHGGIQKMGRSMGGASYVGRGRGGASSVGRGRGGASSVGQGRGGVRSVGRGRGEASCVWWGRGRASSVGRGWDGASSVGQGRGGSSSVGQSRGGANCVWWGRGGASNVGQGRGGASSVGRGRGGASSVGQGRGGASSVGRGWGGASSVGQGRGGASSVGQSRGGASSVGRGWGRVRKPLTMSDCAPTHFEASLVKPDRASVCAVTLRNANVCSRRAAGCAENIRESDRFAGKPKKPCICADEAKTAAVCTGKVRRTVVCAAGLKRSVVCAAGLKRSAVCAAGLKGSAVCADGLKSSAVCADGLKNSAVCADKVRKSDVCADQAGGALPVKQQEVCLQRVRPTLSTLSCTPGPEGPPKRGRGRPPKKRKLDEETTGPVSILAPGGSVGQVGEHGHKSQRKWRRVIIPSSQTPSMRTPKSRACWEDEPGTPLAVAQLSSIYGEEEREGARGKKEAGGERDVEENEGEQTAGEMGIVQRGEMSWDGVMEERREGRMEDPDPQRSRKDGGVEENCRTGGGRANDEEESGGAELGVGEQVGETTEGQATPTAEEEEDQATPTAEEEEDQATPTAEREEDQATPTAEEEEDQATPTAEEEEDQATATAEEEEDQATPTAEREEDQATPTAEREEDQATPTAEREEDQATATAEREEDQATATAEREEDQATATAQREEDQATATAHADAVRYSETVCDVIAAENEDEEVEVMGEGGSTPRAQPPQPQRPRAQPTGTELIDLPSGTELIDVVMGTELIDVPTGTELIDVPTGTELIDVPTGTELIDVVMGTELIDVVMGTELIDVPTGTELIDLPTGTELIDVVMGTELIDVVMGTELIDVPTGTELIDVPTGTELIDVVMGDSTAILERVTHAERRELDGVRVGGGVENSVIRQMGPTEGGTGQEQRGSDGEGADPAGGETERRRTEEEGPGQSQPGSERRDGVTLNLSDPCWAVRERSTGSWELDEEEVEVDVIECSSPAPPPIDLLLETTGVELCDREPSEEEEGEVDVIGETD